MECVVAGLVLLFLIGALLGKSRRRKRTSVRRPPFKRLHDLDRRQSIREFEAKMIRGMFAEGKEVFVTAFCTDTEVLRVTASIGSRFRCSAADRIELWGEKALRLGATQIRQYHNHPDVFGRSIPSRQDMVTHRSLHALVTSYGIGFESLLVYRSFFGRARIESYGKARWF